MQAGGLHKEEREFKRKGEFRQNTRDAVGSDICFCVDATKAVARTLVEEERGLQPSECTTHGAGGATFGEPRLSCSIVAFEEKDWVWVVARGHGFDVVKVAVQHCDELRCVFE